MAAELFAQRGYGTGWLEIPLVAGAIVFDYGRRDNGVYPDKQLGRAAVRAARPRIFPLGARGAGRSVSVGKTFALDELVARVARFPVAEDAAARARAGSGHALSERARSPSRAQAAAVAG